MHMAAPPQRQHRKVSAPGRHGLRLLSELVCWGLFLIGYRPLVAAETGSPQLPPAATQEIEFTRDIKPILETACLRCHGSEKPKGHYRLDSREAALQPGDSEVASIIPGDSAHSPLVRYVALLIEDMEMPPVGKGDPLTADQIGLLRAWIDQGVTWNIAPATDGPIYRVTPFISGTVISGNERKFREHYWQHGHGLGGILQEFEISDRITPDTRLSLSGHAMLDDYQLGVKIDKNDFGFVHAGWEQYRKWYDDTGGYFPALSATTPTLGRDLYLDLGKAWIDFGLTKPDWPRLVLGYEHDYKRGEKSMTDWNAFAGSNLRNIGPASKHHEETVHVLKFDLDHEIQGVTIEERFRGELYDLQTLNTNRDARNPMSETVAESYDHFQGANTLRLEKKFADWLFGSGGYLYSKLDADAAFRNDMTYNAQAFPSLVPQLTLERESHVANLNALVGPFWGFTLSGGVQSEWTRQKGFGQGNLNRFNFSATPPSTLTVTNTTLFSDYDENSLTESAALRYHQIPFTTLFAEARLQQQRIGQSAYDLQPSGNFVEAVDFSSQLRDLRAGFNTSPGRSVSLGAHYRRYENDSRYPNTQPLQPVGGYPGFFNSRDLETDEIELKLSWRLARWLKATASCQFLETDYWSDTNPAFTLTPPGNFSPGGKIHAGESDSRRYSLGVTLTPWQRLYLTTTLYYQTYESLTANNNVPTIAPYQGNVYSALASGNYVFSETSDGFVSYSFSRADFSQNNFAAGLPVGIKYQQHAVQIGLARRLSETVTVRLQYGFYLYEEPTAGSVNNYNAHSIFGLITIRLP